MQAQMLCKKARRVEKEENASIAKSIGAKEVQTHVSFSYGVHFGNSNN